MSSHARSSILRMASAGLAIAALSACADDDGTFPIDDAGGADASVTDTGASDVGTTDTGGDDTGLTDTGSSDGGASDTGGGDATEDAGATDAGTSDVGLSDVTSDTGMDTGEADGGFDAGMDAGDDATGDAGGAATWSEVDEILLMECAGCHYSMPAGLALAAAYDNLVDVASTQAPGYDRVEPGDPEASYLWLKVTGTHSDVGSGSQMPQGGALTDDELATIRSWIEGGALR